MKMHLTIEACATALNHAAMNRKSAIQLELAVGLGVFHMHGGADKEARAMLVNAYAAAGYRCTKLADMDYKTVNRRINATASLFEKLPVSKWVGQLSDMTALQAICEGLAPYELYSIQDVLRYAAPQRVQASTRILVTPNTSILSGPPAAGGHTGQQKIRDQMRRATDQVKNGRSISTEHMSLLIPKDTPRSELIDLAMQLMSLAKDTEKELLTA